jgi:hypothetical protein
MTLVPAADVVGIAAHYWRKWMSGCCRVFICSQFLAITVTARHDILGTFQISSETNVLLMVPFPHSSTNDKFLESYRNASKFKWHSACSMCSYFSTHSRVSHGKLAMQIGIGHESVLTEFSSLFAFCFEEPVLYVIVEGSKVEWIRSL